MTFQELLKDEREAGRAEGITLGERNTLVSLVKIKLEKNQIPEEIAEALEQDVDVIREIVAETK